MLVVLMTRLFELLHGLLQLLKELFSLVFTDLLRLVLVQDTVCLINDFLEGSGVFSSGLLLLLLHGSENILVVLNCIFTRLEELTARITHSRLLDWHEATIKLGKNCHINVA